MRLGTVSQVWRYPVKSMSGERLESATIGTRGVAGDRGWAVRDVERGGVTNAKRLPALRACRARYLQDPIDGDGPPNVEVTLPDGTCVSSDDPGAARRLSDALGREVTLEALGPRARNRRRGSPPPLTRPLTAADLWDSRLVSRSRT